MIKFSGIIPLTCFLLALFCNFLFIEANVINIRGLTNAEFHDLKDDIAKECRNKMNVTDKMIEDLFIKIETEVSVTQKLKCYFGCVAEKMGFVIGAKPDWDLIRYVQTEYYKARDLPKAQQALERCKETLKTDSEEHCELSANIAICINKEYLRLKLANANN